MNCISNQRQSCGYKRPSVRSCRPFPSRPQAAVMLFVVMSGLTGWGGCVFVNAPIEAFSRKPKPLVERTVFGEGKAKIVLIDISRVITTESEEDPFGLRHKTSAVARLEEELKHAASDDSVRALVIRINSPGGTVTASEIAYRQVMNFKAERQVPVVAQLMDVATSGAYYVALAADRIVAYPTTVTGSVGVVFHGVSLEGLFEKIGVRNQTVKSGDKKDIGSPLRSMTAEERELLRTMLEEMKDRFLAVVRERRPHLTAEAEALISDGRILSARQAEEIGLIDQVGALEESVAAARELAGVTKARVVMYRRPDEYAEGLFSSRAHSPAAARLFHVDLSPWLDGPQFLYLWVPQGR